MFCRPAAECAMAVGVRTMAEGAHRRRLGRLSAELRAAVPCAAAATTYDHAAADDEHDAVSEQLAAIGPAFAHLGTPVPLGAVGAMRDSSPLLGRAEAGAALRARLDTDGYLLLRGALGRSAVVAAREQLLARRSEEADSAALMTAESVPLVHDVLRRGPMESIFETLLGGPVRSFDYTWLRSKQPGGAPDASNPHCDSIFMARGSQDLVTAWTPFSDIPLDSGGLMVLEDSYRRARYGDSSIEPLAEYARIDIDSHCESDAASERAVAAANAEGRGLAEEEQAAIWAARTANLRFPRNSPDFRGTGGGNGALADAHSILEHRVAGRWLTAPYEMGDVLLFSMWTLHSSTDNNGSTERLSTDTRYQLASEQFDQRWMGEQAKRNVNPHSYAASALSQSAVRC
jgi:hypothetical protein